MVMLVTMAATMLVFVSMVFMDVMIMVLHNHDLFSYQGPFFFCCHGSA